MNQHKFKLVLEEFSMESTRPNYIMVNKPCTIMDIVNINCLSDLLSDEHKQNIDTSKLMLKFERQFSGYVDLEGTEIYEGDLFKWGKWSEGVAKIVKGKWVFEAKDGDFVIHGYHEDGVVCGNIFEDFNIDEHPELDKTSVMAMFK